MDENRKLEIEKEYSAQHFDLIPDNLIDTVVESAKANVFEILEGGEDCLKKKFPKNETEIATVFKALNESWTKKTEDAAKKLGGDFLDVLLIPRKVVLGSDAARIKDGDPEKEAEKFEGCLTDLKKALLTKAALEKNLEELNSLNDEYDKALAQARVDEEGRKTIVYKENEIAEIEKIASEIGSKTAERLPTFELNSEDRSLTKRLERDE